MIRTSFAAALLALVPVAMAQSGSDSIAGRWDATIQINGVDTPFPLEITGSGANVTGSFFNGDDRYASTKGKFENGKLELFWDYYAATLSATLKDGALDGQYVGTRRMKGPFTIHAKRSGGEPPAAANAPSIAGLWEIPNKSGKGEQSWRFIVQQNGASMETPEPSAATTRTANSC
jgi:hypothetical protein